MRVKRAVHAKKKRKKYLKAAKGYRGALSRRYKLAKQMYVRSNGTPMLEESRRREI